MESASRDYSRELAVAVEAARAAGAYLRPRCGAAVEQVVKAERDVQLDVDLGAERIVLDAIRTAFPTDAILSEEAGASESAAGRLWIVDPLDGSFNFQHGFPLYGTAIALQVDGETIVGVIYLPDRDELYSAVRGQGACCNGAPMRVSEAATLSEAIIHVADFAKTGNPDDNVQPLREMAALASAAGRVRMVGTAAADWAWPAAGRADGVVMYSLHPWDVDAGALLLTEAGGAVTRVIMRNGVPVFVGSNAHIHDSLVKLVQTA